MKDKIIGNKKILILFSSVAMLLIILFSVNSISNGKFFANIKNFLLPYNDGVREKFNFDYGWKFSLGEGTYNSGSQYKRYCLILDSTNCVDATSNPNNALYEQVTSVSIVSESSNPYASTYDASSWKSVSLPHTYNDEDTFNNFNELGGTGQNGERSMYTGTAWYKKEFFVPQSYENKKIYLEFEAARQALEIYVNDTKLDVIYENGFIPVGFDLSPYLTYNATNRITIKVDNSYPYYVNGTNSKVSWHNPHWHPNYGGLYRNAYLYVVEDLHLTLPLYSFIEGQGTYVYASNITYDENNKTSATINVDAEVENSSDSSQTFTILSRLIDNDGNQVGNSIESASLSLAAGEKNVFHISASFSNLKRWSTDYPYMYSVETEVYVGNTLVDNNSVPLGIRTFRFTSDYGFYLNEHYLELNGWGQKSTMEWAGLGAAYPDWMTEYVIKMMKDANANYIRWGHVSGSPVQINTSDKYGLLVTQPGVDSEGSMSADTPYDNNSLKLRIEAFRDMLIYYRNNPSIIQWELGNSATVTNIDLSSEYIDSIKGLQYNKTSGSVSVFEILHSLVEQYDYGNRSDDMSNAGAYDETATSKDRTTTLRQASTSVASYIDVVESTIGGSIISDKPIVESEYNRLESRRGILDIYTFPTFVEGDYYKTSEDYALTQMKNASGSATGSKITSQSYILSLTGNTGGANWIFSDSTSHGRVGNEVARASGEVDAVMLPKEAYYVDQVVFSKNSAIHIIGHWNYSLGTVKDVYVAARHVSIVTLYVGDTSYDGALSNEYLWTFSDIPWSNEVIRVEGKDSRGNVLVTDSITPHGIPASIRLTAIDNPDGIKASGSDVVLIDAEIIDANGNRCITYDGETLNDLVTFTVADPDDAVIWRGGYNSGIENSINSNSLYLEAGINRVSLRTTMNAGTFSVSASTNTTSLTSNTLTFSSESINNTNGLSDLMNATSPYSLTSLADPEVGTGEKLGNVVVNNEIKNASVYMTNFNYTGSMFDNNSLVEVLTTGTKLYSDINDTVATISYPLLNSEFIRLPNIDCNQMALDLLTFETKKNVDIFVLRDSSYLGNMPSWMNDYTLTDYEVTSSTGVIYDVYKKSSLKNTLEVFGGNYPSIQSTCDTNNYVIAVKPTETDPNTHTFFKEDFSDFNDESLQTMWHAYAPIVDVNENIVTVLDTEGPHGNAIHISDINNKLAYVQKSFSSLSNFKFKFDIYMDDTVQDWVNVWLSNGFIELDAAGVEIKENFLSVENYLKNTGSEVILRAREFYDNGLVGEKVNAVFSGISINNWHTFEYEVDLANHRYRVKVDDRNYSNWLKTYLTVDSINTLMFSTHMSGASDYLLDNVEIIPIIPNPISNVRINDQTFESFTETITDYYASSIDENTVVEFDTNEYYISSTQSYDSINNTITLTVVDIQLNQKSYVFHDQGVSELLQGWSINNANDTFIELIEIDGEEVLELKDDATSGMAYMTKTISPIDTILSIKWSAYIKNTATNTFLRTWALNGPLVPPNTKTNVMVAAYLQRTNNTVKFTNEHSISGTATSGTTYDVPINIPINEWHTYEMLIDIQNNSYDLIVDNVLAAEDLLFLKNNIDQIDTVVFATGNSTTSHYYLKDIEINNVFKNPVTNIFIDSVNILNFDSDVYEYTFYSLDELDDTTVIIPEYNSIDYKSHTITKDLITQTATIEVINNNDTVYTYTVNFEHPSLMPVTSAQLQEKVDYVRNTLVESAYTASSWSRVEEYTVIAENLLVQINPEQELISATYYYLDLEINNLLALQNYTGEGISLISDIKYSVDLDGKIAYDIVLDNNIEIYSGVGSPMFRSVPTKYMNSEYFKLDNIIHDEDGEISFTTNRAIDIMILSDMKSGAVTNYSYDENNERVYYEDTGDIATSSDGTVYKIYKKTFNAGTRVIIPTSVLLNNLITNKNHIVALKDSNNVENNRFFYENMNLYNENTLKFAWGAYEPDADNHVQLVDKEDNGVTSKAIRVVSNNNTNAPILYREFAKMYKEFNVTYRIFLSDQGFLNVGNTDYGLTNRFTRVWIINDSLGKNWRTSFDDTIKPNVCVLEAYLDNGVNTNTPNTPWYFKSKKGTTNTNAFRFYRGEWATISIDVNMNTHKYTASIESPSITTTGQGDLYSDKFNYADFLEFAGRKTGLSDFWLKEVSITPKNNGYINNISVTPNGGNASNVNNFISTTKDYLYRGESLENLTVNTTAGSVNSTITTNDVVDDNNELLYTNVDVTVNDVVVENHRIYYEVQTNRFELTLLVERANLLVEEEYTPETWGELESVLPNAINLLGDNTATQNQIDAMAALLESKIDGLILIDAYNLYYTGTLYLGNELKGEPVSELDITNNSSFSFRAYLNKNVGLSYAFAGVEHNRSIVSSTALPEGAKLTMLDLSASSPKYYYYLVTAADVASNKKVYQLTDFLKMGSLTNYVSSNYYSNITGFVNIDLRFIVDFESCLQPLSEGTYSIKLEDSVQGGVVTMDNLLYSLYSDSAGNRTMTVSFGEESYNNFEEIHMNVISTYTETLVNNKNIYDTSIDDKKIGVKLSLWLGEQQVNLPIGTIVNFGETICTVVNNKCSLTFGNFNNSINDDIDINFGKYGLIEPGNYTFKVEFVLSENGLNMGEIIGIAEEHIVITEVPLISFEARIDALHNNIMNNGTAKSIKYGFNKQNAANTNVIVYLQQRIDNTYNTINLSSYMFNNLIEAEANKYTLGSISNWTANFNALLEPGSYRLVFDLVKDGNIVSTDYEYLVVK